MESQIALTSLFAYQDIVSSGKVGKQESQILRNLAENGSGTSRGISNRIGMERSTVCARLNGLVKKELVDDSKYTRCPTTGKIVKVYSFKEKK